MTTNDKILAVEFWNDNSERLQDVVNESIENVQRRQEHIPQHMQPLSLGKERDGGENTNMTISTAVGRTMEHSEKNKGENLYSWYVK